MRRPIVIVRTVLLARIETRHPSCLEAIRDVASGLHQFCPPAGGAVDCVEAEPRLTSAAADRASSERRVDVSPGQQHGRQMVGGSSIAAGRMRHLECAEFDGLHFKAS